MNSLTFERWYPYVAAALGAVVWYRLGQPFPSDAKEFLAAALSFAAILVGFLATAQAILMALPSDSVIAQIKSSGYIDDLVRYMREAFYGLVIFAVLNLTGFFFELSKLPLWFKGVWVVLAVLSLFVFQRVTEIIVRIMRHR